MVYPVVTSSPTFFSIGVKLSEGISTLVLANWLVVMAAIIGKALQKILFGELRLIEIEHIYERSRFTVINSLIALTMFSNDFLLIPGILTLFSLFMKVFHWVLEDRFDHIFQTASTPSQALRTRNTITLLILLYVDFNLVYSCVEYSFGNNPDVYFAFGFEFAVLFLDLLLQFAKVVLNTWELVYLGQNPEEDAMESKALYMKALEIVHRSLVLIIHSFLLFTLFSPYRYPIYLFKDIFFNVMGLMRQIRELIRYQRAAKELDSSLEDATEEEIAGNQCIICMEDMTTIDVPKGTRLYPKKLGCRHIFHLRCLRNWFERSQHCPTCRTEVHLGAPRAFPTNHQNHTNVRATGTQHQDLGVQHQPQPQTQLQPQGQRVLEHIDPPPFMNQHLPHTSGFFHGPRTTTTETGPNADGDTGDNENVLRLRPGSLVPPDWTLLKLSNSSPNSDEYQVELNDNSTIQVKKISQEQRIVPSNVNKREAKQDEDPVEAAPSTRTNEHDSLIRELQTIREDMRRLQTESNEMNEKVQRLEQSGSSEQ